MNRPRRASLFLLRSGPHPRPRRSRAFALDRSRGRRAPQGGRARAFSQRWGWGPCALSAVGPRERLILMAALALIGLVLGALPAAQVAFPQAEISNGRIHAKLYLPDPQNG